MAWRQYRLQEPLGLEVGGEGGKWHNESERFPLQRFGAVAGVPTRVAFAFGIDDEQDPAALAGETQATKRAARSWPPKPFPATVKSDAKRASLKPATS